jgi:putative acetyltransferase
MKSIDADVKIQGFVPGALGRLVELHGTYYTKEWQLGPQFEIKVASDMAAFLDGFDSQRDGFWSATVNDKIVGAIVIDGRGSSSDRLTNSSGEQQRSAAEVRLRCFIVDSDYAGLGIGSRLLNAALDFCRAHKYSPVVLWTFAGLDAARHLYESRGFRLTEEYTSDDFGRPLRFQRFVWSPNVLTEMVIRTFQPGDETAFEELNTAWIEKYFRLEEKDLHSLRHPVSSILEPGGEILFATVAGKPVGCCALIAMEDRSYEIAKMAVAPSFQGRGLGRRLLEATIEVARARGAKRLYLETNHILHSAVHLYESCGFHHLPPEKVKPSPYERADVYMELCLEG